MTMADSLILIKAIRSGKLAEVRATLDAGASMELDDGAGDPGLAMGVACFMGFVDIVRELAVRGAIVNLPDNSVATSPLNMALRGGKTEVVRALIELGAELPDDMKTGLSAHDILLAQLKAQRAGKATLKTLEALGGQPEFEEIEVLSCAGTDTQVLDAEMMRAIRNSH
jgi:ankyrin repeat protein